MLYIHIHYTQTRGIRNRLSYFPLSIYPPSPPPSFHHALSPGDLFRRHRPRKANIARVHIHTHTHLKTEISRDLKLACKGLFFYLFFYILPASTETYSILHMSIIIYIVYLIHIYNIYACIYVHKRSKVMAWHTHMLVVFVFYCCSCSLICFHICSSSTSTNLFS